MIIPILLIVGIIALFFIEKMIGAWWVRFALNTVLIVLIAIAVGNIAITASQMLNRSLYALAMPIIIKQLESSDEAERNQGITLLKELTGLPQSQEETD